MKTAKDLKISSDMADEKRGKWPSISERFWSQVDKSGDCWIWTGRRNPKGYGRTNIGNRQFLVHRLAWVLMNGPIPAGKLVLHKPPCFNRACVRHLYLGDQLQNVKDCKEAGRERHKGPARSKQWVARGDVVLRDWRGRFIGRLGSSEVGAIRFAIGCERNAQTERDLKRLDAGRKELSP